MKSSEKLNFRQCRQIDIIIGLNDASGKTQLISSDEMLGLIDGFFSKEETAYSALSVAGGYTNYRGEYYNEDGIELIFIDPDEDRVLKLASALKMYLDQESVLVQKKEIEVAYFE